MIRKTLFFTVILLGLACFSLGHSFDMKEVRSLYIAGVQALANNDLEMAETKFKSILAFPSSKKRKELKKYKAKANYFLGDVYFMRRKYSIAISYYREVVQKFTNYDIHSRTLYKLGRTLVLHKKYGQAIAILNEYLAKYSNKDKLGDNSLYWIGRAYIGEKDYQLALNTFQLVLNKYPDTALAYDIRGFIDKLQRMVATENKNKEALLQVISQAEQLQHKKDKLAKEKDILEKISELLLIKQKLLEIKAEKVELLSELKNCRGAY